MPYLTDLPAQSGASGGLFNASGSLGGLFGAAGDLFSGFAGMQGAQQSASMYQHAAGYAALDLKIKQAQVQRQALGIIGGQKSDIAASGLAGAGTALDLMRDTAQQAALTKQLTTVEGQAQIQALNDQAKAASQAGQNDLLGGVLGAVGKILPLALAL